MLPEGAAAGVFAADEVHGAQFLEERRLQCSLDAEGQYVAVAVRREGTGFGIAVRRDMEEAATACQTTAHVFLVAREGDDDNIVVPLALVCLHALHHIQILLAERQMFRARFGRYVLYVDDEFATQLAQVIDILIRGDESEVLGSHSDTHAEEKILFVQFLNRHHGAFVNPFAAACVRAVLRALNADDRDKIQVLFQKGDVRRTDEGTVGEDGENHIFHFCHFFQDVFAHHRFASCKQGEVDA